MGGSTDSGRHRRRHKKESSDDVKDLKKTVKDLKKEMSSLADMVKSVCHDRNSRSQYRETSSDRTPSPYKSRSAYRKSVQTTMTNEFSDRESSSARRPKGNLVQPESSGKGEAQSGAKGLERPCSEEKIDHTDDLPDHDVIDLFDSDESEIDKSLEKQIQIGDSELTELLGKDPLLEGKKGKNLPDPLAVRWNAILQKGLVKTDRDSIKLENPVPGNCNFEAPKLNPELKQVVNSFTKERDDTLARVYDNLAVPATIIGNLISSLMCEHTKIDKRNLITQLSDAGRFLTGTMYSVSSFRRKQIIANIPDLEKRAILQETCMFPYLFGADLKEKIKTAQAISTAGAGFKSTKRKATGSYDNKDESKRSKTFNSLNYRRPLSDKKKRSGQMTSKYESKNNPRYHNRK